MCLKEKEKKPKGDESKNVTTHELTFMTLKTQSVLSLCPCFPLLWNIPRIPSVDGGWGKDAIPLTWLADLLNVGSRRASLPDLLPWDLCSNWAALSP